MMLQQSIFRIDGMDCPSEEQLIRLRLATEPGIVRLDFDLAARRLTVRHQGDVAPIAAALAELRLGSVLAESSAAAPDDAVTGVQPVEERSLLRMVLLINAGFFAVEIAAGILARSMGLVADSLDMLADAFVYALALSAVGRTTAAQNRVARLSGYLQLGLACAGLLEVLRRFLSPGDTPDFAWMIGTSALALLGNAACLVLLNRSQSQQAHIRASQIFTSNDVIANAGVILAGVLVRVTGTAIPDLVIGLVVFALVLRGAFRILSLSKPGT